MVKSQVPSHRNMIALSWYCNRFFNIDQMNSAVSGVSIFILCNLEYSRVILLECPPVSIIRHNKDKGHKHPEIYNQNEKLEKLLCNMSLVNFGDIYINWTVFFAFGQYERFIS
jgi:hypothetical protein